MSDYENTTPAEDGNIDPEIIIAPAVEEEEDFFPTDDSVALPNPAEIITVQTSSGGKQYVQTTEPMAVSDVLSHAGVMFTVGTEFWLNGTQIQMSTLVPPAQTLMVVSTVKGGG